MSEDNTQNDCLTETSAAAKRDGCTPLSSHVRASVEDYFNHLDGHCPGDLYNLVIQETEKPLIEATLSYCRSNQSRAANILGISRSTLRKKMTLYDIE